MATKQENIIDSEKLKKQVLEKEDKKQYSSSRFEKIEKQVRDALARQATDDALRDLSF